MAVRLSSSCARLCGFSSRARCMSLLCNEVQAVSSTSSSHRRCHANWMPSLLPWFGHHRRRRYHSHSFSPRNSSVYPVAWASIGILLCSGDGSKDERKFIMAAIAGDLSTLKKFVKNGIDVNIRHSLGWNALHAAIANGKLEVAKFLVENGADVNAKDEFSSALRIAAQERCNSSQVAQVRDAEFCSFINHYVSYSGFTPLHYAILCDDIRLVRYLLDQGADPTLENNRGYIPADYCTNEEIRIVLEDGTIKLEQQKRQEQLEERRRYPLEKRLRAHIVGQEGPITAAAAAIRRREMGWADDDHPMVLLFLGSSGIGKTELAKQIAKYIHKENKNGFIRLDMSEFQEKHEVAKLIGSPPGYIGHDQGGQLTTQLSQCPNAVVLFDEVEKAHPDVLTVLLQLFDEGRLTDGKGKTIECKDALFVMTSNLASDEIAAHGLKLRKEAQLAADKFHHSTEDKDPQKDIHVSREFKEKVVEPILKRHFKRDEFLGRINEMLYFLPFSRLELNLLVEKQLNTWKERAKKKHGIELSWEREVLDVLADGYNVKYGARSLKHEVERVVITQLANAFEQGTLCAGNSVCLGVQSTGKHGEAVIYLKINKTTPHPPSSTSATTKDVNFVPF